MGSSDRTGLVTVSVIICTRNRADSLKLTLESIGRVTVPAGWDAELIVVDNGSTDATSAVVAGARLPDLPVRYVTEPRKGKAHACNTGITAATGQILLFTDDDVRVPGDWIRGMAQPLVDGTADAVAGGVLFPTHIADVLRRQPAAFKRGWLSSTEALDRRSPSRMVGANMAFHRRVLERVPAMDVDLGPGALGFGEETLFSYQLLEAGFKLHGALEVAVEHHFDEARLTPESMAAIARRQGGSDVYIYYHWEHKTSRLAVPRLLLARLRVYWARFVDHYSRQTRDGIFSRTLRAEYRIGYYREFLRQRRRPRKYSRRGLVPR